jgi:hypothetical protein
MRLRALAAVVGGVAAASLAFGVTPASAAQNWQAVSMGDNWHCTGYFTHPVSTHVKFETCIVYNANSDAQAVLVVQNNADVAISIGGKIETNFGSNTGCNSSTLNPGFTRGCFSPTVHISSPGTLVADGTLNDNGVPATVRMILDVV